jgi:hypothetical protein
MAIADFHGVCDAPMFAPDVPTRWAHSPHGLLDTLWVLGHPVLAMDNVTSCKRPARSMMNHN